MLKEGGNFVAKFFKSNDLSYLYVMMKQAFRNVYVVKPQSSRASSAESFVIGIGFQENAKMESMSASIHTIKAIEEKKEEDNVEDDEDDKLTF